MDIINESLSNDALDAKFLKSIQAAAAFSKKMLNRYYDCTNHSELYWVAMGACLTIFSVLIFADSYISSSPRI